MRSFAGFLLLLVLSACGPASRSTDQMPSEKPNLVLIIADDMAWDDSGAYGHPSIKTPHIDRLAGQGMRFDQAFLTTSSCSPSRSSIITGLYPHQTGAQQLHWPLPPGTHTFVEKLRSAGYWTAQAGKWHLGDAVRDHFDLLASRESLSEISGLPADSFPESDNSGAHLWVPTLQYRPADQPFFLWLAAIDPHRGYQDSTIAEPHRPEDARIPPYMPEVEAARRDFARYYDEISRMDQYIGLVMDELERQGVAQNTLILFITDNGRPFPRDKTTLYDGGIKTPWIVRWPRRVQPGASSRALVSSIDIAPSFLAAAGLAPEPQFEGKNFLPLLDEPDGSLHPFVYAEDHWHDFEDFTRAVRTHRFKYIKNFLPALPNTPPADALNGPTFEAMLQLRAEGKLTPAQERIFETPRPEEELYDLQTDPYELTNLAGDPVYLDTLQNMRAMLAEIRTKTNDRFPEVRTPDEFDRTTGDRLPNWAMPRVPDPALIRDVKRERSFK